MATLTLTRHSGQYVPTQVQFMHVYSGLRHIQLIIDHTLEAPPQSLRDGATTGVTLEMLQETTDVWGSRLARPADIELQSVPIVGAIQKRVSAGPSIDHSSIHS